MSIGGKMNLLKQLPYWHFSSQTLNGEHVSVHRKPYLTKIMIDVQNLVDSFPVDLNAIAEDLQLDEEWQNDLEFFSINVSRERGEKEEERLKICLEWTAREVRGFAPSIYLISNVDGRNLKASGAIGKPIQISRFVELISRTLNTPD